MRYLNARNTAFGEDRKVYSTVDSTATAGQTVFNVSYDQGRVAVFLNGIRLVPVQDYTYTLSGLGANITLGAGITANDYLELIGLQGINAGNAVTEDNFVVGTSSTGSGGSYTNSTTVFPVSSSAGDLVSVWRNGIKLVPTTDFTVNATANTVTLQSASNTADEITVHVVGILQHSNFVQTTGGTFTGTVAHTGTLNVSGGTLTTSTAQKDAIVDGSTAITRSGNDLTFAGNATVTGDLTVDTSTLKVDSSNNRVGIGTASPEANSSLHISSTGYHPLIVDTTSAGGGGLILRHSGTYKGHVGTAGSTHLSNSSTDDILIRAQNDLIFASGGNNERIRINSGGIFKLVNSNYIDLQSAGTNYAYIGRGSDLTTSASATDLSLRFDGSNFYLSADATPRMKVTSSGDVTINSGSLTFGTAGKGIDFSNASGSNSGSLSSVLDDYEEGDIQHSSFPTSNGGSIPLYVNPAYHGTRYVKVGNICTYHGGLIFGGGLSGSNGDLMIPLPFTSVTGPQLGGRSVGTFMWEGGAIYAIRINDGATHAKVQGTAGVDTYIQANSFGTGSRIIFSITYTTV